MMEYTYQLHEESENQYIVAVSPDHFFVRDHVVIGYPLLPGAVYLDLMLQALRRKQPNINVLRNMVWLRPFVVKQPTSIVLDCSVKDVCQIKIENKLYARARADYLHPTCRDALDAEKLKSCLPNQAAGDHMYAEAKKAKFNYGPTLRVLQYSWWDSNEALVTWELSSELLPYRDTMLLHPVVVDGAFQAVHTPGMSGKIPDRDYVFVPSALKELTLIRSLPSKGIFHLKYQRDASSEEQHCFDIDIYDCQSQIAAEIRGYTIRNLISPRLNLYL